MRRAELRPRVHPTALTLALVCALPLMSLLAPSSARATPTDRVGFGSVGPGMGNAMVAGDDALAAPIYNPASGVLGSGCREYAAARMPAEPAAATCVVRMVRTRRCANQRETCSGVQPGIVEAYLFRTIRIRVTHGHTQRERGTLTHRETVCV